MCLRGVVYTVVLIVLIVCLATGDAQKYEPKIIGGRPANYSEYPYQVSIQYKNTHYHFCGGSLITYDVVLTAAHCVSTNQTTIDPKLLSVAYGIKYLNKPTNTSDRISVAEIIPHPGYNDLFAHDIALLKLTRKIKKFARITATPIKLRKISIADNTSCAISGWGAVIEAGRQSNVLRGANVSIINREICKKAYEELHSGIICAGNISGGVDSCQGDSGGPLVCEGFLTGVVSFGDGCGRAGFPGAYTEVRHYVHWIEHELFNKSNCISIFDSWILPMTLIVLYNIFMMCLL